MCIRDRVSRNSPDGNCVSKGSIIRVSNAYLVPILGNDELKQAVIDLGNGKDETIDCDGTPMTVSPTVKSIDKKNAIAKSTAIAAGAWDCCPKKPGGKHCWDVPVPVVFSPLLPVGK